MLNNIAPTTDPWDTLNITSSHKLLSSLILVLCCLFDKKKSWISLDAGTLNVTTFAKNKFNPSAILVSWVMILLFFTNVNFSWDITSSRRKGLTEFPIFLLSATSFSFILALYTFLVFLKNNNNFLKFKGGLSFKKNCQIEHLYIILSSMRGKIDLKFFIG